VIVSPFPAVGLPVFESSFLIFVAFIVVTLQVLWSVDRAVGDEPRKVGR
jgi:hypothetical protein